MSKLEPSYDDVSFIIKTFGLNKMNYQQFQDWCDSRPVIARVMFIHFYLDRGCRQLLHCLNDCQLPFNDFGAGI